MSPHRRTALIAGILYLVTVFTSIPALVLKEPALSDPSIVGGGFAITGAAVLEVVMAAACVGTAVVLFPVVRRTSETAALGFVAARIVEAGLVMLGVVAMWALVGREGGDHTEAAEPALRAIHDGAFLLGPGLIPAANGLLLGYALFRARLVPRVLPILAFIGAPLLVVSALASLTGLVDQVSALAGVAALPIAAWEIGLGLWLTLRGFSARAGSADQSDPGIDRDPSRRAA